MKYFLILLLSPMTLLGAIRGLSYDSANNTVVAPTTINFPSLRTAQFTNDAATASQVAIHDAGTKLISGDAATVRTLISAPATTLSLAAGVGLTGGGDLSANRTFTLDLSELVADQVIFDGSQASRTWTFNLAAGDPVWTFSSGVANLSSGDLQVAGTSVRAAGILTSGTVATARLGGGTANGTTFLRGDQTWAAPAGGGDVVGPASATDNAAAVFDGTTGKLVRDSLLFIEADGDTTVTGGLTASKSVRWSVGALAQITGDVDNLALGNITNNAIVLVNSDAARTITGIVFPWNGAHFWLYNNGSFPITLADENASSTAANRFALPSNFILQPDEGCLIQYEDTTDRWRILSKSTVLVYEFALSDETTAITTGAAKVTWRAPYAMTVTAVRASLSTASSSGIPTVDINDSGTTILSTKLTIDANEKTSTTAAAAAVISDAAIADDAEVTFDIDVSGTGAAGLKVRIYYLK